MNLSVFPLEYIINCFKFENFLITKQTQSAILVYSNLFEIQFRICLRPDIDFLFFVSIKYSATPSKYINLIKFEILIGTNILII